MHYYVSDLRITANNDDGETYVNQIRDIDAFLRELANGEHGDPGFIDGHRPWPADPCDWRGAMMIIRGELVTPKPVEVVTRYML